MNVVVIVPWRSGGCPHREAAWRHVRRHYADLGYLVWPADDGGTPFSRGASANRAVAALDADVYLIADADFVVPETQLADAVDQADDAPGLVVAFDRYCYLTETGTALALYGERRRWWRHLHFTLDRTVSTCIAVSAATFDTAGGFDPRFRAWGMEDVAFEIACRTLAGPTRWVHGDGHHLWHPTEEDRPQANVDLLDEYRVAADDPAAMHALLDAVRASV